MVDKASAQDDSTPKSPFQDPASINQHSEDSMRPNPPKSEASNDIDKTSSQQVPPIRLTTEPFPPFDPNVGTPLPPKHQALDKTSNTTRQKDKPLPALPIRRRSSNLAPIQPDIPLHGVPHPVYSFIWHKQPSSNSSGGIYCVLEFMRESDAIAFELAAQPFCEWNVPGISHRQVRVRMPRAFHSAHRSPFPGCAMRFAFTEEEGAGAFNGFVMRCGIQSVWCPEGWPVMFCVDI